MRTDEEFERRLRRLDWDCRRGMKEVEVLLLPFRERFFDGLPRVEQEAFLDLLDCEDVDLLGWLTQQCTPQDPRLARMVNLVLERLDVLD